MKQSKGQLQLVQNHVPGDNFLREGEHLHMTVTNLPPGAWLTREQVYDLLVAVRYGDDARYAYEIIDELFGESEASE